MQLDKITNGVVREGLAPEQVTAYYDDWAAKHNYEGIQDLYNGPKFLADLLAPRLSAAQSPVVLDVGAGTGFLGVELNKRVPECTLDALEPAVGMLETAKARGVYRNFYSEFVNGPNSTSLPSDAYDCTCSAGCFSPSHVPPVGVLEMMRLTKPGGLFAIILRQSFTDPSAEYGQLWCDTYRRLEEARQGERVKVVRNMANYYDGLEGAAYIYKKL